MADNCRDFDGASDVITKADPTGIVVLAAWSWGCWYFGDPDHTLDQLLRLGGPSGVGVRGYDIYLSGSDMLSVRTSAGTAGDSASGYGALGESAWLRIGVTRASGTGVVSHSIIVNGTGNSFNLDPADEITTGDEFRVGDGYGGSGTNDFDGRLAWMFWLQGVQLSAADMDTYLNDPLALYNAYGPTGTITANALKILWPMQCDDGSTETDKSGVGNNGTITGATFAATGPSPSTPWNPCAADPRNFLSRWTTGQWVRKTY